MEKVFVEKSNRIVAMPRSVGSFDSFGVRLTSLRMTEWGGRIARTESLRTPRLGIIR
jgi:hypothetical protein